MDQVKNFAKGILNGTIEAADTSITLLTGHGDRFPAVPFNAVIWNATDFPDPSDDPVKEIVRVTARTGDTFTSVTRAQEGTSAEDHNEAGKTYQILAGLTALGWSTLLGDVFGSGPALTFDLDAPNTRLRFSDTDARFVQLDTTGLLLQSERVFLGDSQGVGNSGVLDLDDANSRITLSNLNLATTQIESATVAVGTLAGKLAIRDGAGDIVGYLPIYTSIT